MNYLLLSNYSAMADIVALLFLALFALFGFIRGFAKSFLSVFGTIIAIVLAVLLAPALTELLQTLFSLINVVADSISGVLSNIFGEQLMNMDLSQASEEVLASSGLAGFIVKIVFQVKSDGEIPLDTTLNQIIGPTFAYYVVLIISAVVLFVLFKILFIVLRKVVKLAYAFPLVKNVDKLLGAVFGFVNGIFNLELVILAISIIPIALFQDIYAGIQASILANFIEDINLYGLLLNALSNQNIIDAIKNAIII